MKIIKKIIHFLSTICYLLIGVYAVVVLPKLFGYEPLVVLSGSMEPTFKTGSVIYYKEVKEEELKVGDVITFQLNGSYISHRIHSIENHEFETKGDANESVDPIKLTYKNIVGRDASVYIPYVGYYIRFVNENLYLVAIVVVVLIAEVALGSKKAIDINERREKYE